MDYIYKDIQLENNFRKVASMDLSYDSILSYVDSSINKNDVKGSVMHLLTPTAILVGLNAIGFTKLGVILGVIAAASNGSVENIIGNFLNKIIEPIKSKISSDEKVSEEDVDRSVKAAIDSSSSATKTSHFTKQEIRMIKIASIKTAGPQTSWTERFRHLISIFPAGRKSFAKRTAFNLIGGVVGIFIKILLISAGLSLAGNLARKLLGKRSAFDSDAKPGEFSGTNPTNSISSDSSTNSSSSKQISQNNSNGSWLVPITNTESNVKNLLLKYTHEVYPNTKASDQDILNDPGFNVIVDQILGYNQTRKGYNFIYMPSNFGSKKEIVDYFIKGIKTQ